MTNGDNRGFHGGVNSRALVNNKVPADFIRKEPDNLPATLPTVKM